MSSGHINNKKLSKHNRRQSSIGETTSLGSTKSDAKSIGSNEKVLATGNPPASSNGPGKPASILNVAEMLLPGAADNEILDFWLKSIDCGEFLSKFIDSGYDMPTISRITPQDLTAIGVTEPTKRVKILIEIKKLNLQDGIPNFKPINLSHWLELIRLNSLYYKSLCDQQVDTIEKLCQLTWEDFEELGISKLGHQKRFQLAIEKMKELESLQKNNSNKAAISEPIYDTNPSQILLVASSENHSMNGPIINKQSSTGELSSTGSGSMHSVYSAASTHYQPSYATLPVENQPIYGTHQLQQPTPPPPIIYQSPSQLINRNQQQQKQQSQQHHNNRQSMGQLPFNILANLPKHQQQLLQQSSIYATLSRQPAKVKQPPPPVPIRTNSLKSNSLTEQETVRLQSLEQQMLSNDNNLFGSGISHNTNYNSNSSGNQTLTKNKSFSGNAHMEASRARFLDRQSQQQQQYAHLSNITNGTNMYGFNSDTNSTKSLQMTGPSSGNSSVMTSPVHNSANNQIIDSASHDSGGSSQTLYNSASSGSTTSAGSSEQNFNNTFNQSSVMIQNQFQYQQQQFLQNRPMAPSKSSNGSQQCNATTGRDDDFPPPPSPLSIADIDDGLLVSSISSVSSTDNAANGYNDVAANHVTNMMTFRIGGI